MGDAELAAIATLQEGLVTRPQARAHLTPKQVASRLASGRLVMVRWGVYRYAGAPTTRWQELRAACLAAGADAVASHRSAAAVWGFPGVAVEQPELTAPWPMWPRLPGVRSHTTRLLPSSHVTAHEGVPVTTPERTLADLSGRLAPEFLGTLIDATLRRGLVHLPALHSVYRALATHGRRGLASLGAALERRPIGFQAGGSAAELDVVATLVDAGLPRPVQQHQVVAGGTVYLLDAAYPELRLGVEYDGFAVHRLPSDLDRAAARANALQLAGWTVLHFTAGTGRHRLVAEVAAARARCVRALTPSGA